MEQSRGRDDQRRCESATKSGRECRAKPINGGRACFFHDEKVAVQRAAARERGGRNKGRGLLRDAPDVSLGNASELRRLVEQTISEVRRGEITPKVGSVIGYLATIGFRVFETCEFERRLADLETTRRLEDPRGENPPAAVVKNRWR
jgi:hypothetical protein